MCHTQECARTEQACTQHRLEAIATLLPQIPRLQPIRTYVCLEFLGKDVEEEGEVRGREVQQGLEQNLWVVGWLVGEGGSE
jgi:hypothetical protein